MSDTPDTLRTGEAGREAADVGAHRFEPYPARGSFAETRAIYCPACGETRYVVSDRPPTLCPAAATPESAPSENGIDPELLRAAMSSHTVEGIGHRHGFYTDCPASVAAEYAALIHPATGDET